jgi:hypothetical protein
MLTVLQSSMHVFYDRREVHVANFRDAATRDTMYVLFRLLRADVLTRLSCSNAISIRREWQTRVSSNRKHFGWSRRSDESPSQ